MSLVSLHPRPIVMAKPSRRQCFFTLYVIGGSSMATATGYAGYGAAPLHVPHAVQVVLGLLMVFVVPGLSFVCATSPDLQSWVERLLASVGISVIVATCAVVLLAATPIGFSRQPFGELLGSVAVALSLGGLYRARLAEVVEEVHAWTAGKLRAWAQKLTTGKALAAPRPNNSAKSQQDRESDGLRSVVVLRFSFDGKPVDPEA
jgi:hypothetical protein